MKRLPLEGVRVVEFAHMVMGPSCGLVLADLGAEVIKVEPLEGDNTRRLQHAGAGFFPVFNRNKKSLAIDLKSPEGKAIVGKLLDSADVMTENFRPGALDKLGFSYLELQKRNPRLVYCSLKGFLDGPYDHRASLDEVVQMMGGLAYMTGLPDRPLRAGSSVVDIMGGTFAAVGILAALRERDSTGKGKRVTSALFESTALLVAQHMARFALTGEAPRPMPVRDSGWGVYDVFEASDEMRVFIAVVTDGQWRAFCDAFAVPELAAMEQLATNRLRVDARDWLLPELTRLLRSRTGAEICELCERAGVGFAPIRRPEELFDDPHLARPEARVDIGLEDGSTTWLPGLPLELDNRRLSGGRNPPRLGEHTAEVAEELGYGAAEIGRLVDAGVLGVTSPAHASS